MITADQREQMMTELSGLEVARLLDDPEALEQLIRQGYAGLEALSDEALHAEYHRVMSAID